MNSQMVSFNNYSFDYLVVMQSGSYEKLASGGDYNGEQYSYFDVYIYPNTSGDESDARNDVGDAIIDFAQTLVDGDEVSFYNIYLSNNYPKIGKSNKGNYLSDFDSWLENNNYYDTNEGSHLAITDNFGTGRAYMGSSGDTAFTTGKAGVMGTQNAASFYKNGAIQEVCHNYFIESELDAYIHDDDHDLGTITDGDEVVTPMATSYTGPSSHSQHGLCGNNYWFAQGRTTDPTSCTTSAIDTIANLEVD